MITINTYIFLSILGITTLSMFLNIYITIQLFKFFKDDVAIAEEVQHQNEIKELEVDNLYLREEIKELNLYLEKLRDPTINPIVIQQQIDEA